MYYVIPQQTKKPFLDLAAMFHCSIEMLQQGVNVDSRIGCRNISMLYWHSTYISTLISLLEAPLLLNHVLTEEIPINQSSIMFILLRSIIIISSYVYLLLQTSRTNYFSNVTIITCFWPAVFIHFAFKMALQGVISIGILEKSTSNSSVK